jgi:hypothetical protein
MLRWFVFGALIVLTSTAMSDSGYAQGLFNPTGRTNAALATRDYIVNRPTVSPYLNLLRAESGVSAPNYQTLVRPALEMRQRSAQQQSSIRQLQSRVTNMQGQVAAQSRGGSGFATGHPSRFMTYLHYYPGLNR